MELICKQQACKGQNLPIAFQCYSCRQMQSQLKQGSPQRGCSRSAGFCSHCRTRCCHAWDHRSRSLFALLAGQPGPGQVASGAAAGPHDHMVSQMPMQHRSTPCENFPLPSTAAILAMYTLYSTWRARTLHLSAQHSNAVSLPLGAASPAPRCTSTAAHMCQLAYDSVSWAFERGLQL